MSIGGLQATVELSQDEVQLIDLVSAVEALPTRTPRRDDLVIAVLPATKCLCRHAEHFDDSTDAVDTVFFRALH